MTFDISRVIAAENEKWLAEMGIGIEIPVSIQERDESLCGWPFDRKRYLRVNAEPQPYDETRGWPDDRRLDSPIRGQAKHINSQR